MSHDEELLEATLVVSRRAREYRNSSGRSRYAMVAGYPKKVLQRYFYQFRIPLRYGDVKKLIDICSKPDYDVSEFPKRYNASVLLRVKRALESCRKTEGIATRKAAEAESNLLEAAADMGDPSAIALLCGARMRQPNVSEEDMTSGSDLLKKLMDAKFPLAFKVSGDLAYTMGRPAEAQQFYELALANGLDDTRLITECYRNIGHLAFKASELVKAREAFTQACIHADNQKDVSDCHFFLAQLRETDRTAMRKHLEVAATFGFHDSFVPLGNLMLNWYGDAELAQHWFQLATVTDKSGLALIGLFDCAVRLNNFKLTKSTVLSLKGHVNAAKLFEARPTATKWLEGSETPSKDPQSLDDASIAAQRAVSAQKQTRWDF